MTQNLKQNSIYILELSPLETDQEGTIEISAVVNSIKDKRDLPFAVIIGKEDNLNVSTDAKGIRSITGAGPFKGGLKSLMDINEIKTENPDYALYPYWGYPSFDSSIATSKNLKYDLCYMHKEGSKKAIAEFVLFESAGHAHSDYFATLAWSFISQFSRLPEK